MFFSFLKDFRKESILAPLFKLLEAVFELCVPLAVASLIDDGIAKGDMHHILMMALLMVALGIIGLLSSVTAQYFAAKAATGFAANAAFGGLCRTTSTEHPQIDRKAS